MTGKAVQKGQEDMSGRKEAEKKGLHRKRQKKISGRHIVLKKQSGIRMLKDRREQSAGNDGAALLVIRTLCVVFLAAAWWNAFLNIFTVPMRWVWLAAALAALSFLTGILLRFPVRFQILVYLGLTAAAAWCGREVFPELVRCLIQSFLDRMYPSSAESLIVSYIPEQYLGLAAAALTAPMVLIWQIVLKKKRGKFPAGFLILLPFILSACAGYFPDLASSWLLLLTAGVYFAAFSLGVECAEGTKRKTGAGQLILVSAALAVLAVLSVRGGILLDGGREVPGGVYQKARNFITEEVIGRAEEMIMGENEPEEETQPENSSPEDDPETIPDPDMEGDMQEPDSEEFSDGDIPENVYTDAFESVDFAGTSSGGGGSSMDRLKEIGRYTPDDSVRFTLTWPERPSETVYFSSMYGDEYTGDAWLPAEEWLKVIWFAGTAKARDAGNTLREAALEYPDSLDRLERLCREWDTSSLETVGEEINDTFSRLAVYDTEPGTTPDDRDFAEYFLFENHRGFCVHFATAATLLYRMCGYPALYVEGYAVPPSAFHLTENGEYEAAVDGTMGHAWCMVYDEKNEMWDIREHTPGSSGTAGTEENNWVQDLSGVTRAEIFFRTTPGRIILTVFPILAGEAGILAILYIQAAVRRGGRKRKMARRKEGEGICTMYREMTRMAALDGRDVDIRQPVSRKTLSSLKSACPEITEDDWEWAYDCVMRNLYYYPREDKDSWNRMQEIYCRFRQGIWEKQGIGKKLIFRFIYSL